MAIAAALMATGCGKLTIRSWVNVDSADSDGFLATPILGPDPVEIHRLTGGFLGAIALNTTQLPGPLDGTISVDDVRIAGDTFPSIIGAICVWGDPAQASTGTIHLDVLGSTGSATLNLNLKSTGWALDILGLPPGLIAQSATFPLSGVGISQLLNASTSGSSDGLFATSASFVGDTNIFGAPASFSLDLVVNNESKPPLFDADLLDTCGKHFAEQGKDIFYGLNSKSSYLLASGSDQPTAPLVIKLADLGAKVGDNLKIDRVGTYDDTTELRDGNLTKVGALFSSSNVVNAANQLNRVPGAIDAGTDVSTGSYLHCIIFPFCTSVPTDITQDFAVTSGAMVKVPAGAQYLIVAPIPDSLTWGDNSGFGLGVAITVNP
ncbi:MAG: hypothetical protein ACHQ6T_07655 [Myxococcota bacterium]